MRKVLTLSESLNFLAIFNVRLTMSLANRANNFRSRLPSSDLINAS